MYKEVTAQKIRRGLQRQAGVTGGWQLSIEYVFIPRILQKFVGIHGIVAIALTDTGVMLCGIT